MKFRYGNLAAKTTGVRRGSPGFKPSLTLRTFFCTKIIAHRHANVSFCNYGECSPSHLDGLRRRDEGRGRDGTRGSGREKEEKSEGRDMRRTNPHCEITRTLGLLQAIMSIPALRQRFTRRLSPLAAAICIEYARCAISGVFDNRRRSGVAVSCSIVAAVFPLRNFFIQFYEQSPPNKSQHL